MEDLKFDDLEIESIDIAASVENVGLEALRMGHGFTELGASCCCSGSECSCCAAPAE